MLLIHNLEIDKNDKFQPNKKDRQYQEPKKESDADFLENDYTHGNAEIGNEALFS